MFSLPVHEYAILQLKKRLESLQIKKSDYIIWDMRCRPGSSGRFDIIYVAVTQFVVELI